MTSLYFKLAVLPILLFTLFAALIRAQPYTAPDILNPLRAQTDCPMPCLLGIKPGMTRVEEAVRVLQSSGWVEQLTYSEFSGAQNILWHWSPAAPPIFQSGTPNEGSSMGVEGGVIQFIELKSSLTWGEAYLLWGKPKTHGFLLTARPAVGQPPPPKPFLFLYDTINMLVLTDCPYLRRLWTSPITLITGDTVAWLNKFVPPRFASQEIPIAQFILSDARSTCRPVL